VTFADPDLAPKRAVMMEKRVAMTDVTRELETLETEVWPDPLRLPDWSEPGDRRTEGMPTVARELPRVWASDP
jgi:hypothetical protein